MAREAGARAPVGPLRLFAPARGQGARPEEEGQPVERVAGSARAHLGPPRTAVGRPAAHARQSSRGPRPALDLQVPHRRCGGEAPCRPACSAGVGGRRRYRRPGDHVVRPLAGARRRGAARHHRHAASRRGTRCAAARRLLRFDADRRADLAHHDRRRRHPQPRRHRPGAARRQHRHGHRRARRLCST